jgi:hypothetical protein
LFYLCRLFFTGKYWRIFWLHDSGGGELFIPRFFNPSFGFTNYIHAASDNIAKKVIPSALNKS